MKAKSLKILIDACSFDYISPAITDENIPDDGRRGKVEIKNFGKYMTSEQVIAELKKDNCRPATVHELFSYLKDNKEKDKWLVALGSVFFFRGERYVVGVWWDGSEREANHRWFDGEWLDHCWFAFVRELDLENSENGNLGTLESRISALEEFQQKVSAMLILE